MKLRARLLVLTSLLVAAAVGLATWTVALLARRAFERADEKRTAALVADFRRELERSGAELVDSAGRIAASESIQRIALEAARPERDLSDHVNDAAALAAEHRLDFADLAAADGTLLSSAEWPARFGYREEWLLRTADWSTTPAFFRRMELAAGPELGLVAVRAAAVGDRKVFVVVGRKVDAPFFGSLGLPEGMRVLLYQPGSFRPEDAAALQPLIERVRQDRREVAATIEGARGAETFLAGPLEGHERELLGVLLVGSSRSELAALVRRIHWAGAVVAAVGIAAGLLASYWLASNVTRPVERLAAAARRVASGDWETRVEKRSSDEIGELVGAFNTMTRQLVEQRDRLLQTERVAAWRELARRLAHELKNPLFPIQITVENLARARERDPAQFDEVFRESTATLLAEIAGLKDIVGRFSDFARMPPPELAPVELNEVVRAALRLVDAQLRAPGRPEIRAETSLDAAVGTIQADVGQIGRALQNLVLNAIDAMPAGGTLSIRTRRDDGAVRLEVSDTGEGLTPEECERLFTPYYTTKHHGTGLGLAIVQSVVSDHRGRISVSSEPGRGTTFRIDLPGGAA